MSEVGMTPEANLVVRRLDAQTKLTANAINPLAIAIVGAAAIIPGVTNPAKLLTWQTLILILAALGVQFCARAFLDLIRSEEWC